MTLNSVKPVHLSFAPRLCSPDGWCWQNRLPQGKGLLAVTQLDATSVIAVGSGGTVLRCRGDVCTAIVSDTTQDLYSVWGSDANSFYVAGDNGTVLRCSVGSSSCTALTSGMPQTLYAVWGSDPSNV